MTDVPKKARDRWDKAEVILKPVGGLLTAVTVVLLGWMTSGYLDRRQASEANFRLYSELLGRREEAESNLRKDMFTSIIKTFIGENPEASSIDEKVLDLELLVYNFHESLNLKPLFTHLRKEIINSGDSSREDHLKRLQAVAREVTKKQLIVLEGVGEHRDAAIDLVDFRADPERLRDPVFNETLSIDGITRDLRMYLVDVHWLDHEVQLRLHVETPGTEEEPVEAEFWVGPFDFPMIDHTRLSHDQRCAIVLSKFDATSAELTLVCYPGTYASLRERPYFEDLVHTLLVSEDDAKDKG